MKNYFLGVDVGTTGARAMLVDESGNVIASHSESIESSFVESSKAEFSEQDPRLWRTPLLNVIRGVVKNIDKELIRGICFDSTSGTIIPVDENASPLTNAFMHNDVRAREEAEYIREVLGITVKPSFAISKILWIKNNMPDIFEKTACFIHAADYIRGIVSGNYFITDFSNAVKTGYNLENERWPEAIESKLGIPLTKLPEVVPTGMVIGNIPTKAAEELGISPETKVVAGATDSTTSFYSSGAEKLGDWNTTLGTVLGIRGIVEKFIPDPQGLLYTHKHPEGYWLPGAASNTGGEALRMFFGRDLELYDRQIESMDPTGAVIYPLVRKSEKFPFYSSDATGFIVMDDLNPARLFRGFIEGISYVERLIYEKIEEIGYRVNDNIFSMGGGAYSLPWMEIRASVMSRSISRAKVVETAFGAAVIAASGVLYKNLTEAIDNMVKIEKVVYPDDRLTVIYEENYQKFIHECRKRGYLS